MCLDLRSRDALDGAFARYVSILRSERAYGVDVATSTMKIVVSSRGVRRTRAPGLARLDANRPRAMRVKRSPEEDR
jgi:hypothetical protein